jgi:hypothetical protein
MGDRAAFSSGFGDRPIALRLSRCGTDRCVASATFSALIWQTNKFNFGINRKSSEAAKAKKATSVRNKNRCAKGAPQRQSSQKGYRSAAVQLLAKGLSPRIVRTEPRKIQPFASVIPKIIANSQR